MKKKLLFIMICFMAVGLFACKKEIKVTSITITGESAMYVGDTQTLVATVYPDDASNKDITWAASDQSIATVNDGVINAKKVGEVTITVSTTDDSKISKEFVITITEKEVLPTSITLSGTKTSIGIDEEFTVTVNFVPSDVTNKALVWISTNTEVATVDANGNVKGISIGTTTITVKTINNLETSFNLEVTKAVISASSISSMLTNTYNSYANSLIGSARMTITSGETVSVLDFVYDFSDSTTINKAMYLFTGTENNSIYIRNRIIYIDTNGVKSQYEMDSSEDVEFINNYNFKKFFSEGLKYMSDTSFFNNLTLENTSDYVDVNNAVYEYSLDLAAYNGTSINTIGKDAVHLYVTVVDGAITAIKFISEADGVSSSIFVQFLGLVAEITYPAAIDSYPVQ